MKTEAELERALMPLIRQVVPSQFRNAAITSETRLQRDLGLDSLGIASLLFQLESAFSLDLFGDPDLAARMSKLRSVGDLIALASSLQR